MKQKKKNHSKESIETYASAIKDFAKSTIHNPDFFHLSREEQKQEAMKFLNDRKKERKN